MQGGYKGPQEKESLPFEVSYRKLKKKKSSSFPLNALVLPGKKEVARCLHTLGKGLGESTCLTPLMGGGEGRLIGKDLMFDKTCRQ